MWHLGTRVRVASAGLGSAWTSCSQGFSQPKDSVKHRLIKRAICGVVWTPHPGFFPSSPEEGGKQTQRTLLVLPAGSDLARELLIEQTDFPGDVPVDSHPVSHLPSFPGSLSSAGSSRLPLSPSFGGPVTQGFFCLNGVRSARSSLCAALRHLGG